MEVHGLEGARINGNIRRGGAAVEKGKINHEFCIENGGVCIQNDGIESKAYLGGERLRKLGWYVNIDLSQMLSGLYIHAGD